MQLVLLDIMFPDLHVLLVVAQLLAVIILLVLMVNASVTWGTREVHVIHAQMAIIHPAVVFVQPVSVTQLVLYQALTVTLRLELVPATPDTKVKHVTAAFLVIIHTMAPVSPPVLQILT